MSEVKFLSPDTLEQAVESYSKSSQEGKTKILVNLIIFNPLVKLLHYL